METLYSVKTRTNPRAFHYPSRMLAAFLVSMVTNVLVIYSSVGIFKDIKAAVCALAGALCVCFPSLL